jgi:hypothetical protein
MANRCRSTVSTQLETAKILIGIGNYAGVSVFHDFPEGPPAVLSLDFGGLYLDSNYATGFPKNGKLRNSG